VKELKFEIENIKKAIAVLKFGSNGSAVLVDILVRDSKDYKIKCDFGRTDPTSNKSLLDEITAANVQSITAAQLSSLVHTVVLYKQNNEYLVIDPSNSSFSKFLIAVDPDIRAVYVPQEASKIYQKGPFSPPNQSTAIIPSTGPEQYQWRDCIDLAVKLAFGFNFDGGKIDIKALQVNGNNHVDYIEQTTMETAFIVKSLSNQSQISGVSKLLQDNPLRVKQSSDLKEVRKIHIILQVLSKMESDLLALNSLSTEKNVKLDFAGKRKASITTSIESIQKFFKDPHLSQVSHGEVIKNGKKLVDSIGQDFFAADEVLKLFGETITEIESLY